MLMRKSLASIDAEGRRCYLEATRAGLPMYLNLGWKVVDEIRTDVGKYDVAEPYVELTPFMMREAAATQGQK